jgi:hypothetical protein
MDVKPIQTDNKITVHTAINFWHGEEADGFSIIYHNETAWHETNVLLLKMRKNSRTTMHGSKKFSPAAGFRQLHPPTIPVSVAANESQAHSPDSRFLLSFMNARTAKFFVNLLRLLAVNRTRTENILSTYAWIFDLKLQYFLRIYIPHFVGKL